MKASIITILLIGCFFYSKSQTITCHNDSIPAYDSSIFSVIKTYYDTTKQAILDTVITSKDTIKTSPIYQTKRICDTAYISKCNFWCWLGLGKPVITTITSNCRDVQLQVGVDTIHYKIYDTSYSLIWQTVITPIDIYVDSTIYDTTYTVIKVCDTTYTNNFLWGAKWQGSENDQIAAQKALGGSLIRPVGQDLISYTSGTITRLQNFYNNGFKNVVNVAWDNRSKPYYYFTAKDTSAYKTKLNQFLKDNGKLIYAIVCENEPTNFQCYSTSNKSSDYLYELNLMIRTVEQYNSANNSHIIVLDGSLNVLLVNAVMTNQNSNKQNVQFTKELIAGYAKITSPIFFVDLHLAFQNNQYTPGLIKNVVTYLNNQTKHQCVSNETHTEGCTPSFVPTAASEWYNSGVLFCMFWSGNPGKDGDAYNINALLTDMGISLKNYITPISN